MSDRFCPSCGERRTGAFRFCRGCRFDFEEQTAAPEALGDMPPEGLPVGASVASRRSVVRYAAVGVVALLALGAVGSLMNGAGPAAPASPAPSATTAAFATDSPMPPTDSPAATTAPSSASAFGPTGSTQEGTVTRVIDGDTIVAEIGGAEYHVRYIGMDTPEDVKPNTPVEAMSREAAAANTALVGGKTAIFERDVSETDRFGRLLRDVWIERDGALVLVGLELVRTGYAQVTTFPPDVKYVDLLLAAQDTARSGELGLWAEAAATPAPTPKSLVGNGDANCHPSYTPCLPKVDDLDCADVRAMGKAPVKVKGPDDYRLDADGDGIGCD